MCSVTFTSYAITCVVWSLYVLIGRTAGEIRQGQATGKWSEAKGVPSQCILSGTVDLRIGNYYSRVDFQV